MDSVSPAVNNRANTKGPAFPMKEAAGAADPDFSLTTRLLPS
ncbi:hypothetical protein D187_007135 [Cystobacter fuscus DSM 2262]|uniref:Uncharacterized protein n=1 Tax=Cystobacter fuscus (strain ATCC 25194 / DSM 2262 / NBRC 100088 / M29) TaxID=1242864 RepID=S9P2J5_CYSF2|nr:hypothetical protein D187_007135 [Cystobacter fuscus DSM 2262]